MVAGHNKQVALVATSTNRPDDNQTLLVNHHHSNQHHLNQASQHQQADPFGQQQYSLGQGEQLAGQHYHNQQQQQHLNQNAIELQYLEQRQQPDGQLVGATFPKAQPQPQLQLRPAAASGQISVLAAGGQPATFDYPSQANAAEQQQLLNQQQQQHQVNGGDQYALAEATQLFAFGYPNQADQQLAPTAALNQHFLPSTSSASYLVAGEPGATNQTNLIHHHHQQQQQQLQVARKVTPDEADEQPDLSLALLASHGQPMLLPQTPIPLPAPVSVPIPIPLPAPNPNANQNPNPDLNQSANQSRNHNLSR